MPVRDRPIGTGSILSPLQAVSAGGCGNQRKSVSGQKPRKSWTPGKRSDSPSVYEWLERWIRTEKDAVGVRTMTRYEQIVRDFLRAIGDQAAAPLEALSTATFLEFKERWLSEGRHPDSEPDDQDPKAPF